MDPWDREGRQTEVAWMVRDEVGLPGGAGTVTIVEIMGIVLQSAILTHDPQKSIRRPNRLQRFASSGEAQARPGVKDFERTADTRGRSTLC